MDYKQEEFKPINIEISAEQTNQFNQDYIDGLVDLLPTHSTIPTHIPNRFVDCIWAYWDGATTYELYIYINNSWKKTTLT